MRGRSAREPRLDPVRWRRPGRSVLFRSAVVAALVVTAAVVMWSGSCEPSCPAAPAAGNSPSGAIGPGGGDPLAAGNPQSRASAAGGSTSAGVPPDGGDSTSYLPGGNGSVGTAPGRVAVPPGSVGVPIRPAEPTALKLLQPGDRVDVFSVPDPGESPQAIATAALVLGVTGADDPTTGGLLLALTPAEARRTVTTPGGYAVLLRPD